MYVKGYTYSLMPYQHSALNKMHQIVANAVNIPANQSYDPHMTLINTKNAEYKNRADDLAQSYVPIVDAFVLSIGECDEAGQFSKVLHKSEMKASGNFPEVIGKTL
jgi:2'-5' RNA ligase